MGQLTANAFISHLGAKQMCLAIPSTRSRCSKKSSTLKIANIARFVLMFLFAALLSVHIRPILNVISRPKDTHPVCYAVIFRSICNDIVCLDSLLGPSALPSRTKSSQVPKVLPKSYPGLTARPI